MVQGLACSRPDFSIGHDGHAAGTPTSLCHLRRHRFFDPENGDLPDVIDLHFRRAPGFERLSHVEYSKLLRDKVAEAEEKAAAERREKGIKLLGHGPLLRIPVSS
jgi:hypothetical protein